MSDFNWLASFPLTPVLMLRLQLPLPSQLMPFAAAVEATARRLSAATENCILSLWVAVVVWEGLADHSRSIRYFCGLVMQNLRAAVKGQDLMTVELFGMIL